MKRRDFLAACGAGAAVLAGRSIPLGARGSGSPGFSLVDVTSAAGLDFRHNNGAYGGKFLPETLGAGCAFIDYDADGWQDILFVNGMDWPGHKRQRSTLRLYRNNRNGTFSDVTRAAGLDVELYGMGVAVGDFDNDGFPDLFVTCVGQSRLFRNTGSGAFVDVTRASGLGGREAFSTSAMWVDVDRDGLLDLFVCNYVRWSPEHDVFCSLDGKRKSYCTPEAYRGDTCWLFRNRGNGTFEDVTAACGIFDSSSKSLGVALVDQDQDGWPDIFVANDTQPNKLYRNQRNGTFKDVALEAGVALSEDGRARAGAGHAARLLEQRVQRVGVHSAPSQPCSPVNASTTAVANSSQWDSDTSRVPTPASRAAARTRPESRTDGAPPGPRTTSTPCHGRGPSHGARSTLTTASFAARRAAR